MVLSRSGITELGWYAYTYPKGTYGNALQGQAMKVSLLITEFRWRRADQVVLVHTMGKVGSKALAAAIESAALPGVEVFHSHRLIDHRNPEVIIERQGLAPRRTWYVSSKLAARVAERTKPCVVLSVVRDPMERNVSGFFQTIERYLPDRRPLRPGEPHPSAEQLVELFIERYPHDAVTRWAERELGTHFGVDPYEHPFDRDRGYGIIEQPPVTIGIARHDLFPGAAEAMLRDTMGLARVELPRRNTTDGKHVGSLVRDFNAALVVPDDLIDRVYSSRYAQHFGFTPRDDLR